MLRSSKIRTFAPNDFITDADIAMYGSETMFPVSSIVNPLSNIGAMSINDVTNCDEVSAAT